MASPQAAAIDALFDSFKLTITSNPDLGLAGLREMLEKCGDLAADPGGVDYFDVSIAGVPCLWAVPHGCAMDRVLLALHGGGFYSGSRFSHRKMYAHLARAAGCRALLVDYPLAPEQIHPAQAEATLQVYQWLHASGIAPAHIALVGDSAGGNLCLQVALLARARGLPLPAACMPLSPWLDPDASAESMARNADVDRLISHAMADGLATMYLGPTPRTDPFVNAMHADFSGFPPTYIQVGGYEVLEGQALAATARMVAAGVAANCEVFPEMQHVFQFMAGRAPEADEAIGKLARWVRPLLGL